MDAIDRLSRLFERFPGIGPRQAQRFVQFLLRSSPAVRRELADTIAALGVAAGSCPDCGRFHAGGRGKKCSICLDPSRDDTLLLVIAHDVDIAAIDRSSYHGHYFVLGGLLQLGSDSLDSIRLEALEAQLEARPELREIILALPANTEGDSTSRRLREILSTAALLRGITITALGRGLSTGSEIEYADPDTLANALKYRH